MTRSDFSPVLGVLFAFALLLAGCEEATLGPELFGTVQGRVADFDTGSPLAGASITTSPPSGALVSAADGSFAIEDLPAGNYTITARRPGYQTWTASIAVQENRTTQASVFLQAASAGTPADTTATLGDLTVDVTNFYNRTRQTARGDSVVVVVEYRVRNTGTAPVPSYEAYFRVVTPAGDFLEEVEGRALGVGQVDIGRFEKETGGARASAVRVDGVYLGGQRRGGQRRGGQRRGGQRRAARGAARGA